MKGSMLDLFLIFIIIFIVAIGVYASSFIMNIVSSILQSTGLVNPTSTAMIASGTTAINWFDYLLPFLGVAIGLSSIALAYFFPSHPLFFGLIGIMMLFIGVLIMPIISNIFETFYTSELGTTVAGNFVHLNFFMLQMPLIYTVMGMFMMIVIFTRSRQGNE